MGVGSNMLYTCEELISQKEKRLDIQKQLIKKFNMPILFMKVNYPYTLKDNLLTKYILKEMDTLISDIYSDDIQYKLLRVTAEGPNSMMVINEPAEILKETAVFIQDNHILGKVMHISVYNNINGALVTREELGLEKRRCIVCDDYAEKCIKGNRHTKEDIILEINRAYIEYRNTFYENIG